MRKINLTIYAVSLMALVACQKQNQLKSRTESADAKIADANQSLTALAAGRTWYVDKAVTTSGNGTSLATAFKTIQEAANVANLAGDLVLINGGDYYNGTSTNAVLVITNSGAAGNPITYQAYNMSNKPKIHALAGDNLYRAVAVQADHIVVNGLEVIGDKSNCVTTTPNAQPKYRTTGIQVGADNSSTEKIYDVIVENCAVHDFPGGGIGTKYASQLTIKGNVVYNNCYYSEDRTSGISIVLPSNAGLASDGTADGDATHPKNFILNNLCYNNQNTLPNSSDGSGIIVDVNKNSAALLDGDFRGYTRVENNVCANNGGAGIAVTSSQNIEIVNNTTRNNRLIYTTWGEVFLNVNPSNIIVSNNLLSATTTSDGNAFAIKIASTATSITCDYNLFFPVATSNNPIVPNTVNQDGNVPGSSHPSANLNVDPKFVAYLGAYNGAYSPGATPTYNEFKVLSGSPAINSGSNNNYKFYAYNDFLGTSRSGAQGLPDRGAFEYKP